MRSIRIDAPARSTRSRSVDGVDYAVASTVRQTSGEVRADLAVPGEASVVRGGNRARASDGLSVELVTVARCGRLVAYFAQWSHPAMPQPAALKAYPQRGITKQAVLARSAKTLLRRLRTVAPEICSSSRSECARTLAIVPTSYFSKMRS